MSADATIATTLTITPGFTYRRLLDGDKMIHGIVVAAETGPEDEDGNPETVISVIELGARYSDTPVALNWTAKQQAKIVFYPTNPADWNLALATCKTTLDENISNYGSILRKQEAMRDRLNLLAPMEVTTVAEVTA